MLDAAVALAFAFDMKEKPAIVKRFIGLEFRFYSEGLDDDRVLDRIKKGIVPALAESLRNLCRATEEFTQALKIVTQALEDPPDVQNILWMNRVIRLCIQSQRRRTEGRG